MKKILFLLFCLVSIHSVAQLHEFQFPTKKMSAVLTEKGGVMVNEDIPARIEVNILGNGPDVVIGEGIGKYRMVDLTGKWEINELGALIIKMPNDDYFSIHRKDGHINVGVDGNVFIYTNPVSVSGYQTEYDKLYKFLKEKNLLKTNQAKSTTKPTPSGSTSKSSSNETLKTVNISVEDFVTKAFGIFPINSDLNRIQSVYEQLKTKGYNPDLSEDKKDLSVYMTPRPDKFYGKGTKKKLNISEISNTPDDVNMGIILSQYSGPRVSYQFCWRDFTGKDMEKQANNKRLAEDFALSLFNTLKAKGYALQGSYKRASCTTSLGEISLVYTGDDWVGLYVYSK